VFELAEVRDRNSGSGSPVVSPKRLTKIPAPLISHTKDLDPAHGSGGIWKGYEHDICTLRIRLHLQELHRRDLLRTHCDKKDNA
jgi:hypothetical protein